MSIRKFAGGAGFIFTVVISASPSVSAQQVLRSIAGDFHRAVGIGDLQADGFEDFLLADFADDVHVYSGQTLSVIRSHSDASKCGTHGWDLDGGKDFDGDQVPDYVIVTLQFLHHCSTAKIYSGASGVELFSVGGAHIRSAALVGDLDDDQRTELAVEVAGDVQVYSSVDQSVLWTLTSRGHCRAAGDVNGDQVADLLVSNSTNGAEIYSGADQSLLIAVGSAQGFDFAEALRGGIDVSNDGVPDVLGINSSLQAALFSGSDGALLGQWGGGGIADFVFAARYLGDVSGDGTPDFYLGFPFAEDPGVYSGIGRLYCGSSRQLLYQFVNPSAAASADYGIDAVGLRDTNEDGVADLLVAGGELADERAGASLYLDLWERLIVQAGDSLSFSTSPGPPGNPAILFIVEVNGAPLTFNVAAGFFNGNGQFVRPPIIVPPGFAGFDVGYRTFALDAQGQVVQTALEILELR